MKIHLSVGLLLAAPLLPGCGSTVASSGSDYPDKVITRAMIRDACIQLDKLLAGNELMVTNYVVWQPDGNLGFGEHAAVFLQYFDHQKPVGFVIDIGRRPKDSTTTELSVLRVFDFETFRKYTNGNTTGIENIAWLCPPARAKTLARSVLSDLAAFINSPNADPKEWHFNLLFNNCARYAQERIAAAAVNKELREKVLSYSNGTLISPTGLRGHLSVCNSIAMSMGVDQSPADLTSSAIEHLNKLPPDQLREWMTYIEKVEKRSEVQTKEVGPDPVAVPQLSMSDRLSKVKRAVREAMDVASLRENDK